MTDEFIREVDEDVKEEKRLKLWKKFFPYVVSISLGIVLFTSGFVFWEGYSNDQRQKLGDDFTAAVVLAGEDDLDASLIALDRIVDKGSDGYVTMAKMKKASILIEQGRIDEGLEIYKDLEQNAVDQSFRDIATILYVLNSLNNESKDDLLKKIIPLENSEIWKSSALELKGYIYLRNNEIAKAVEAFETISKLPSKPGDLSQRAKNLINLLKEK
ncbi:MAG: tetratricopeptide repeat protein [Alphaproteobacteria bacterium]